MSEKISVVFFELGKKPELRTIERTLANMQELVKGEAPYGIIQCLCPWDAPLALICHDEGKLFEMKPNRMLIDEEGNLFDVVVGPCFICGSLPEEDNFSSIPEEYISSFMDDGKCRNMFPAFTGFLMGMLTND